MTITKSYTIWCDGVNNTYQDGERCENWCEECLDSIKEMRELYSSDWTFINGKDYCPACSFARGYRTGPLPHGIYEHSVLVRIPEEKK